MTLYFAYWLLRHYLPVYYALINTLKTNIEYYNDPMALPQNGINWVNFTYAFKLEHNGVRIGRMFWYTIVYVSTFTLANVGCSFIVAYVIARYKFKGRYFLYGLIIATQIIPVYGTGATAYLIMDKLDMIDNYATLWLSAATGFDYSALIFHSYITTTAETYKEAAEIDGASGYRVFLQIMVPILIVPVFFYMAQGIISAWNNYTTPMLYAPNKPTIALGIYYLRGIANRSEGGETSYFAAIIIMSIPMIILFTLYQKFILGMSMDGGLKG